MADGVRRAVPSPLKARVAAAMSPAGLSRLLLRTFPSGIPAHGAHFLLDDPVVPPSVPGRIVLHSYESAEIRMIKRHLRADLDVVELGSSLGVTSVLVGRRLDPHRRLICVEANAALHPVLAANLRRNGLDRTEIVGRAISYDGPEVGLRLGRGSSDTRLAGPGDPDGSPVRTTTLGELLDRFAIDRYALVCDIEGAELAIIEQDGDALARCQQLLIELHDTVDAGGRPVLARDLRERLLLAGFRLQDEHGNVAVFDRAATTAPAPRPAGTPDAIVRSFFRRLPEGTLLNLGAGSTGCSEGRRVAVGVDIDPAFRPDGLGASADAAALPFRDAAFDGALLKDVIEHVADPIGVAAEVARVCRPDAHILVTTPRAVARAVWADPTHVRGFTARALVTVLDKAGWEAIGPPRRIGGLPGAGRLGLEPHLERLMAIPGLGHWYGTNWIVEAKLRRP